jgi:hypothetical protein|nr:SMI1/KNR4 family protein [Neorhizobium tomejilense]
MPTSKIEDVVQLLQAQADRYKTLIPLPDDDAIRYVEAKSGLVLPPDYKYLVQNAGNIALSKDLLYLRDDEIGRGNLLVAIHSARQAGVAADWLPICHDNGDYYCLLPDGSVQLWSHDGMFEGRWLDLADWVVDSFIGGN